MRCRLRAAMLLSVLTLLAGCGGGGDDGRRGSEGDSAASADAAAFCAELRTLDGERQEAYVGSAEHLDDIEALAALAPARVRDDVETFRSFLASGAVDPGDPETSVTETWPAEVQDAIGRIQAFDEERCGEPPSTTTSSTSSVAALLEEGRCPGRETGTSSPAVFDPARGTYAAMDLAIDGRVLSFDVVQWLSGEDANEAHRREYPDDPEGTAPNDYYLVNESPAVRSATVADDAVVAVLVNDGQAAPLLAIGPDAFAAHLEASGQPTYWLTFDDGTITGICQQFRP